MHKTTHIGEIGPGVLHHQQTYYNDVKVRLYYSFNRHLAYQTLTQSKSHQTILFNLRKCELKSERCEPIFICSVQYCIYNSIPFLYYIGPPRNERIDNHYLPRLCIPPSHLLNRINWFAQQCKVTTGTCDLLPGESMTPLENVIASFFS